MLVKGDPGRNGDYGSVPIWPVPPGDRLIVPNYMEVLSYFTDGEQLTQVNAKWINRLHLCKSMEYDYSPMPNLDGRWS